ncbi:c-type cytochrome [Bosea sp. NPDC003192]|uniref:c-type cytochrome n=1 Tax=Bosea sp. NPDC003192 TaxID=3390551 RepID=UPI003D057D4E
MPALAHARRAAAWLLATPHRALGVVLAIGVMVMASAVLFAWSGAYNVAASTGHFRIVDYFLRFGMENSVRRRAPVATLPEGDDDDRVRLGAGHFHAGCAYCHGSPGTPISPVAASMLPPPPDLNDKVGLWRDGELFWLVKHGLKYAGMPGFPSLHRDDEIWAVVAFLRRLPSLDRRGYRELALGEIEPEPQSGAEIATGQTEADAIGACARCHGARQAPPSRLVPILHGQPTAMIENALRAYAAGERDSGVMQTAAADLSNGAIGRLARYYASLPRPVTQEESSDPAAVARGEAIARDGVPSRSIPSCLGCHGAEAAPEYPRLAGQSVRYLEGQLAVWRAGLNDRSVTGKIMAPIARRLSEADAQDVAAYFTSLAAAHEAGR